MTKPAEELYLIDGSSYIYRAFHAMPSFSSSQGCPTGAIFGFTAMLNKTIKDRNPIRIAVIFDAKGPTFRHELFTEYKANRSAMPEELKTQIPYIHKIVRAYGLPVLSAAGYEADDIIATLTDAAVKSGKKVVIVSGDKDLMQLVSANAVMWDPQKDVVYDEAAVKAKYGVSPQKLTDFFALVGDSSDNVPGVPGIGPKIAAQVMDKHTCLEDLFADIENIQPKRIKEKLEAHKNTAFLSRSLISLNFETPVEVTPDNLVFAERDVEDLRALFKELELKRFLDELPTKKSLDFSGYCVIQSMDELTGWIDDFKKRRRFAVDLETTSTEPTRADLVGISLCAEEGKAAYIPVGHTCGPQLPKAEVLELLRPLLEDASYEKIGQNIKYDIIVLRNEGVSLKGICCDTMLASYVLDPSRRGHGLDDLAQTCLEHRTIPIKELIGVGKSQILFSDVDIAKAYTYACEDAEVTFRLANILHPRLISDGLGDLFDKLELPLIPVLVDMESAGVLVDTDYLQELSKEFGEILSNVEAEVHGGAGEAFNINSPKQLSEILFNKLGLKPTRKTKTGSSTALDVLEELALVHELPRKILEYRSIHKLKTTYADALIALKNPRTGRIHTSFNQAVTATGRLSSSDPNLQNIPIRTAEGRKIRRAFIPAEGHLFVAADYSQIELRVMAHVSGDERLKHAFSAGQDVHMDTAVSIFDLPPEMVTSDMRRKAKAINFGIIYGMGAFKLGGQIGVDLKTAKRYLEDYYRMYSGVKAYMDEIPRRAAETGHVTSILGRKRLLPEINSTNKVVQQAARRVAINTTIQGSAADLMKLAMIKAHEVLGASGLNAKLLLQVHDELLLEAPEDEAEETARLLTDAMESAYELSVPLVAEAHIGKNWDEVH